MGKYDYKQLYEDWEKKRTIEETRLYGKILDYEYEADDFTYFDDMCFDSKSILKEFLVYDNGMNAYDDLNLSLEKNYYRYYIKPLSGCAGFCDSKERTITIDPKYANDGATILHEMIHAHESIIFELYPFMRDVLMLCLYNKLRKEIFNLDDRMLNHAHVYQGKKISDEGGNHDMLFFFKSLELDLRCGYKLGTVCGYKRDEFGELL